MAPLWRRLTATLVAALLALQSALPLVAPAPAPADSETAAFWRELGIDLAAAICRTDRADAARAGGPGPGAPHDDHHSQLCKALCGAGGPALTAAAPPAGPITADAALSARALQPLPHRHASAAQPRAPPHLA